MVENLEFHNLNGEAIWDGVVTVGKNRAELQIEAPESGPSDAQNDTLAELIKNCAIHRKHILSAITEALQARGVSSEKIVDDRMDISIVCVSSPEKAARLVMIVDLKLKGLLARSYTFQANLTGKSDYSVSIVE